MLCQAVFRLHFDCNVFVKRLRSFHGRLGYATCFYKIYGKILDWREITLKSLMKREHRKDTQGLLLLCVRFGVDSTVAVSLSFMSELEGWNICVLNTIPNSVQNKNGRKKTNHPSFQPMSILLIFINHQSSIIGLI